MSGSLSLTVGAAPTPMFGNAWLALGVCLLAVAALMAGVAFIGRWLAATHPDAVVAPAGSAPIPGPATRAVPSPGSDLAAVIAASVSVALGQRAKIVAIKPVVPVTPSVEMLMQQWSIEGRRQIYSSHQIR